MFTKIITAALVIVSLGLGGCAGVPLDPNRPLPSQPQVSAEVKAELAGGLKRHPLYFDNDITYYRVSAEKIDEMLQGHDRNYVIHFTTDFPKTESPSADEVTYGAMLVAALKQNFIDHGYQVVSAPCSECVTVKTDSALLMTRMFFDPKGYRRAFVKSRIFWKGTEVLSTRDDWVTKWNLNVWSHGFDDFIKNGPARIAAKEIIHDWGMAIDGSKESATTGEK